MGRLELSLLGTPEVRHAGQVLTFPTRKVLALLSYLVVEGGLHAREHLTALFWPESDEERARASFRRALALLRQTLGEPADRSHLLTVGDRLGCNVTVDLACDLLPFQAAARLAREAAPSPRLLSTSLQSAVALYRGEFLESFSLPDTPDFENWIREQREVWQRQMEDIFDRLAQIQEEEGAIADALETANRWRRCAPLNEHAYTRLMRLHFAVGDRGAALRVYADCQAMLAAEFQTVPTSETETLARHIRSQTPPPPGGKPRPAQDATSLLLESPLVGRERELTTLMKLYHDASHHQARVVVLSGEAGIGKTRLASKFLTWAAAEGADPLQGRAFETGGQLPYHPLLEALRRRLERENAPEDLLSDVWLAALTRLLPELRERYPDLPLPFTGLSEAEARAHLFEAVARLFQALAERAPLLLFLDDLHWADTASLDLLQYLVRDWALCGVPVLTVLCLREEALAQIPALSDWVASLERALPLTRLHLGPLSVKDTLRLVRSLGPRASEPGTQEEDTSPELERFGQWLFAETEGQPFFLVETLKTLLEQGQLTLHLTESGTWSIDFKEAAGQERQWRALLPSGVRELIRTRLARLSPEARGLLAAAAVLGQGFTFEHLTQVVEMPEQEGVLALEEGLRGGLLQETSTTRSLTSDQPYSFAHDKIREVVYAEAGEARRRLLHRRALEVLQQTAAPVAALAHHALAARLFEPAFRWSAAAGDEAARLFAMTEAQQHYSQALEALSHVPETEDVRRQRVETMLKLVKVSWTTENPEQHLARLDEAEALARVFSNADPRLLARVHYWIGFMAFVRHALPQALASFQQVFLEAEALGDEELLTLASLQIARTLAGQGQFGQVEALLAPVIPRLEAAADWTEWIFAVGFLGISLTARGRYTAGLAAGQRALARAQATNSRDNMARSHFFLGVMYGMSGNASRMLEESSLVVDLAQQAGDWVLLYLGHGLRGWAQSRLGQHGEAIESMTRSQDFGKQHGERLLLTDWMAAASAEVLLAAGRIEEAQVQAEVAMELARSVGSVYGEGLAERVWGQALASASPPWWEEAEAHLAASLQALETGQALLEAARTQVIWGHLCRERGDETAALEHFGKAAAQLEDAGLAREREKVRGYLMQ